MGRAHESGEKRGLLGVARTAEEPGQTANVDLCFVPATHMAQQRLPAVSGSSGRLVVSPVRETAGEHVWPGQVFADPGVDYADAMHAFVAASTAPRLPPSPAHGEAQTARTEWHRLVHNQTMVVRAEYSAQRAQRRQEDRAWQDLWMARRTSPDRRRRSVTAREAAAAWRAQRVERQEVLAQRRQEDARWQQQRQALHDAPSPAPATRCWIAVLILTDNCTRQCLGLPLFEAGPKVTKVTAEMVRHALETLLPPELQFLISDRGIHFTARAFGRLAYEAEFMHVLIARHRPQSNGIAERFVRTLKEWLAAQAWDAAAGLAPLLRRFLQEYNARPHQGLSIPGLSPDEFARRLWLL